MPYSSALAQDSILERLVNALEAGYGTSFWIIAANIADNSPAVTPSSSRFLASGDTVTVGFDKAGNPVGAQATSDGVYISPAQAASMSRGLAAGLYPLGSALYELPPGAQLALYAEDQNGFNLARAREQLISRINGSIQNLLYHTLPDDLVEVTAVQQDFADPRNMVRFGDLSSTVLGAVNTGQVVIQLSAEKIVGPVSASIDVTKGRIFHGYNVQRHAALAASTHALNETVRNMGSMSDSRLLAINLSSSNMEIHASITNMVRGQGVAFQNQIATAIGAVNGGILGTNREYDSLQLSGLRSEKTND